MTSKFSANPWLKMWVAPRETIREIIQVDPKYRLYLLAGVYGFAAILHIAQSFSLGAHLPWGTILLGALVFSVFVGLIGFGIVGKLLQWTGGWIGGKASFQQIRAALAWANVTNVVNILMWFVLIGGFGGFVFFESFAQSNFIGPALWVAGIAFLVQSITAVWGFVILLKALGEVQGFSAWKGLLNVIIVFALVAIISWVLAWIFWSTQAPAQVAIL